MPPGSASALQPRRDVHAVAGDIVPVDHDVAHVDAQSGTSMLLIGAAAPASRLAIVALDRRSPLPAPATALANSASSRRRSIFTMRPSCDAIAGSIDFAARSEAQPLERARVVALHHARVADHVGDHDRRTGDASIVLQLADSSHLVPRTASLHAPRRRCDASNGKPNDPPRSSRRMAIDRRVSYASKVPPPGHVGLASAKALDPGVV